MTPSSTAACRRRPRRRPARPRAPPRRCPPAARRRLQCQRGTPSAPRMSTGARCTNSADALPTFSPLARYPVIALPTSGAAEPTPREVCGTLPRARAATFAAGALADLAPRVSNRRTACFRTGTARGIDARLCSAGKLRGEVGREGRAPLPHGASRTSGFHPRCSVCFELIPFEGHRTRGFDARRVRATDW